MTNKALIDRLRDQQTKFMTPILGEAADALEAREWQPIETAPKDGTVVLVWYTHTVRAGAFSDSIKKAQWLTDLGKWRVESVGGNLPPVLTAWQALPTPPEDK